jgi:hypothetical protein
MRLILCDVAGGMKEDIGPALCLWDGGVSTVKIKW